jgi:hypothetical protein
MSKSPTKGMTRAMQEKPAKAMAETKAKRHRKRRTNRGAPRRDCKWTARASAPGSREGSKKVCHQDRPRSTKMWPVGREAMITPEGLVPRDHQEERIDETDQDQQYCHVTDQEARGAYCSSTPDILTKPLAEDKLRTSRRQMYGHEPEQAEPKGDGPAPARARQRTWMHGHISRERSKSSDWWSSGVNGISHTCRPSSEQHENRKWRAHTRPSTKKG